MNSSWTWLKRGFATTRWSLVKRSAAGAGTLRGRDELCHLYWHPLYAFLRGRGYGEADARDHVQSFMTRLVQEGILEKADPGRGKFRAFLLTVLLRHVCSERKHAGRLKRGGGAVILPLDWADAESVRLAEAERAVSPEDVFRRSFAVRLVDEALDSLRARYAESGQAALFDELLPTLEGPLVDDSYAQAAARLQMKEGAVRVAVFRMRERFRESLRAAAATVWGMPPGPELDEELREWFG